MNFTPLKLSLGESQTEKKLARIPVKEELFVDYVLAVFDQKLLNRHAEHLHILADLSWEKTRTLGNI